MKNSLAMVVFWSALAGAAQAQPGLQRTRPANPFSIAGMCNAGLPFSLGASAHPGLGAGQWSLALADTAPPLNIPACNSGLERAMPNGSTSAWLIGANYAAAAGTWMLGYGRTGSEANTTIRQWSLAYEYPLSLHSYLFADAFDRKGAFTVRQVKLGVRAGF